MLVFEDSCFRLFSLVKVFSKRQTDFHFRQIALGASMAIELVMDETNLEALEVVQVRDYEGDRKEDMDSVAMNYRPISNGKGSGLTTHPCLV